MDCVRTAHMPHLFFPSLWILFSLMVLSSCQQTQSDADPDAPIFGQAATNATFLVSADEPVGVEELVRVARIIGPYRQLEPQEIAALEIKLKRELDRLVDIEFEQMLKEQKSITRHQPFRRIIVTRESARERLLARLGKDLALPLLTSDNRSAVVFGRISKEAIKLSPTAYEISPSTPQEQPQQVVTPSGVKAKLFNPLP